MSWKRLLHEPLVHFLVLGACIFLIHSLVNSNQERPDSTTISVDDNDIDRLVIQYKQVWNEDPAPSTIQKLIDQYVQSEVMYREALALKLDHNDEIIKRRLKQKYEFLVKDMVTSNEVSDQDLKAYYEDHASDFTTEKLYSFYQFYFSPDNRNNPLQDATKFLQLHQAMPSSSIPEIAHTDLSHLDRYYKQHTIQQIRKEFGIQFSDIFQDMQTDRWYGPIASGYGIHLLYIKDIQVSELADFYTVKDQVLEAYEQELITEYNQSIYKSVSDNYSIDISLDKWAHVYK